MSDRTLEIGADDFARRFSQRLGRIMWFLGAGTSAASGIPTAGQMIWEFKRELFISQRKAAPATVSDFGNPHVRARLQAHIDTSPQFPPLDSPDEYAALFEATYPAEADRRTYIDSKMNGARPSFGHMALATLMREDHARIVWTTNFDPLVSTAASIVFETTGALTTVDLDAPGLARQCVAEQRWPVEIKLHGDFRSRRLKNTSDELRHQDVQLRQILIEECQRFGLIVVGYSGRDESVMTALEEALSTRDSFPAGLFWIHRDTDQLLPRVKKLIDKAIAMGVESALVMVPNFDEILRDIIRIVAKVDTTKLDAFAAERQVRTAAPRLTGARTFPVVRLNAIPVVTMPTVCRLVVCKIGGFAEVREAVAAATADVIATRRSAGVLAFGGDSEVKRAFAGNDISEFDLYPIESRRLRYDSAERGLLRDALMRAITRHRGLGRIPRRNADLLFPLDTSASDWDALKQIVGGITGTVPAHSDIQWSEGLAARLAWANDKLWLLVEPRLVFAGLTDDNKAVATDFARERNVTRYNRILNDLINFWSSHLSADGRGLSAFGAGDGVDAVFQLSIETAHSWRLGT